MKKEKQIKKKDYLIDISIFLIIVAIFGVALLSFYPGLVSSDGVDQIQQARTGEYVDAHPIAHSFVVGNLAKLGGLWVPALFQILVFAFVWTYAMKVLRKYNDSKKLRFFEVVFTIFISIMPVNFMFSISVLKDILYSYAMLLSIIYIYIGIKENWNYSYTQIIFLVLSNIMVMKFRHNGLPIGAIIIFMCLVLNFVKNKNWKKLLTFIIATIALYEIFSIPAKIYLKQQKAPTETNVLTSTKIYVIGSFLHEEVEIEPEDLEFLDSIYDIELWKNNYEHYSGSLIFFDPVYKQSMVNFEYDKEGNKKLDEIFWKYTLRYPFVTIKHFAFVNSIWWSPYEFGPIIGLMMDNDGIAFMNGGEYDTKPFSGWVQWRIRDYIEVLGWSQITYMYNYRPAVHLIIGFVLCCILWKRLKKFSYMLLMLPSVLNIGTYILLISSQDLRYFYPTFLTGFIVFAIYIAEKNNFIKKEEKIVNDELNMGEKKDNQNVLIIVPAYNESLNIEKTIKDIKEHSNYDYVIINDCSKDNTLEVIKKNNFNYLSLPVNYGLTSGIQLGMKYALENGYDIAIQFDGDGQHQAVYLKDLVKEIEDDNCDIAIGSRFVTEKKPKSMRMLGSNIISACIKITTGKKIKDPTSGMRAYNRNVIEKFVKDSSLTPEPDTIAYLMKKGKRVKEVQVQMSDREFGESYLKPLRAAEYMTNIILSILFFRNFQK